MPLYDAFETLADLTKRVGISMNEASEAFCNMATTTYDFSTMSDIVENRVIKTENSISDINICIRSSIEDLQEQIDLSNINLKDTKDPDEFVKN